MNPESTPQAGAANGLRKRATAFIVLVGVVSLFADMTYEAARSITGPYLAVLGASGAAVGLIAGAGELAGYALRLASGWISDRTGRHWAITIAGYAVNVLVVPALALAGSWPVAALLVILERCGKGLRTPARDAMLSYATRQVGRGWGFGLHEALDQTGATVGPLIVAAALELHEGYRFAFAVLLAPALAVLFVVVAARLLFPKPSDLEPVSTRIEPRGFARAYWVYLAATCAVAVGYADFSLIAFHFERAGVIPPAWIPVLYAMAMVLDGGAALVFGRLFDRRGMAVLVIAALLSALVAPLAFLGGPLLAAAGVALWGIGTGAQESVMRAAVAQLTPVQRRATAYGVFNLWFGVAWFAGSAAMGLLYDVSIPALVALSVAAQLISIPLFVRTARIERHA